MEAAEFEPDSAFEDKTAYHAFFLSNTGCRWVPANTTSASCDDDSAPPPPHRELIREGPILRGKGGFTDTSDRYLFLMTDVLLVAQPTGAKKKTFTLKDRVPLVQAWITDQLFEGTKIPDGCMCMCVCVLSLIW